MRKQFNLIFLIILISVTAIPVFAFESGQASWYGGKFQGRKTANGEIFDTNKLTAAHKTLPFNTIVKVTNLKNNKVVQVRINDRGPFVEGRIIDLSRAAAEKIGMSRSGIANVKLEIVSLPHGVDEKLIKKTENVSPIGIPSSYRIQIASFSKAEYADNCLNKIKQANLKPEIEVSERGHFRIVINNVQKDEIPEITRKLKRIGFNSPLIRNN
ncbi:MAG: septal ring lytic transglycosylase RlpA family protein [Spirochaetales bacterium]|nr:septal ring lytic transglycosylase RlpA family protein [Spirochaetales bacterium]